MHGMASESWELASPNSPSHLLESEHDAPPREGLPLVGTQASLPSQPNSMGQLLAAYQIPADLHPAFQDYHPAEFGLVATSLEDLDSFLAELVYPTAPPELLIKARIRRLWRHCHAMTDPTLQRPQPSAQQQVVPQDSSWVESFPKKLDPETVRQMVQRFKSRYPSETLGPESMPGPRLLALVAKQVQDHHWRYVPWKWRLSEEQHDMSAMSRPAKVPRLDALLFDEVPEREVHIASMGKALVHELLSLQATAIAMCGGAHLHSLKEMIRLFMARLYERYPADSHLRSPSVSEAQLAEQKLWQSISSLYNEQQWSLDQAIHEVVVVRNELQYLLMPRPARGGVPQLRGTGRGTGKPGKGADKGSGKGKKGGKDWSHSQPGLTVAGLKVGLFYMAGKERKNLCRDFQLGRCTRGKDCRFEHVCGVLDANGRMCKGDHDPSKHKKTPH